MPMSVTDTNDNLDAQRDDAETVAVEPGFASILFEDSLEVHISAVEPDYFGDLNLDQILAALTSGREDYKLAPFFYQTLHEVSAVEYRHDVLRDLQRSEVADCVRTFAAGMGTMRKQLAIVKKLRDPFQRELWFMSAVDVYCSAVRAFADALAKAPARSSGLTRLLHYLTTYSESDSFVGLDEETTGLERELAELRYAVLLKGLRVTVRPYEDESDLTSLVEETFAKFRQGAVKSYLATFPKQVANDPVEQRILALVAALNPELFERVGNYVTRRRGYVDAVIARFDREVQFYLSYLEYIEPLQAVGLPFSYPSVTTDRKRVHANGSFDLALAHKLVDTSEAVVCNDVELDGSERIIVVTGPNQGGKTTFARMFGQLHHLAALGLPVPGVDSELFLPDRMFAHFEREEDLATLHGKFEDELVRLHEILSAATGNSVLIMNESFNSTTLRDALWVGERVIDEIVDRDMICLCVTFIDELASLAPSIVSMMSTVDSTDPTVRTFRVVRKPADGLAYAVALAQKHGVGYEQLKKQLTR
jgi:DNA mismatch repair protein MutS